MTLPEHAELLGANPDGLAVGVSGASLAINLHGKAREKLIAILSRSSAGTSPDRIYLTLENIRGSYDASVLNVYVNPPGHAAPCRDRDRDLLAGNVALYGLGQASIRPGESGGQGLDFLFDITPILLRLLNTRSLDSGEIRIHVSPSRPGSGETGLVVGRAAIFAISHG